jgi:antirestriction protein ArdC
MPCLVSNRTSGVASSPRFRRTCRNIGSWLEVLREDNRAIVRAASQASKAADFLLAFLPGDDARASTANEREAA